MARLGFVCGTAVCCLFVAAVWASGQEQAPTPGWIPYHAKSENQRREAIIFDDLHSGRLKPRQMKVEASEDLVPPGPQPTYSAYLQEQVCDADLVVAGRAVSSESFLTAHESGIVTDYDIAIEQVFRGSPAVTRPQRPTTITVGLIGGKIDTSEGPLEVTGGVALSLNQQYVLFLKAIQGASSYRLSGPVLRAASVITSLEVRRHINEDLVAGTKSTATVFADLRTAAAGCSPKAGDR